MSERPPPNVRRKAPVGRAVTAPADPLPSGHEDSPSPPGATTTTVRPPAPVPAPARPVKVAKSGTTNALKLVAGIVFVLAASIAVAWGARRYIMSSPRFAIRTVLVDGVKRRSADDVAETGGIVVGKNIFALDLELAGAAITADPWIERAQVTRTLPNTVRVTVVEREARAMASIGGELYLVTRDGEPFKRFGEGDPDDLAIVTGIPAEQVVTDRSGVVLEIKKALDVVEELERVGLAKRYPPQEFHLEKDGALVVTIGREAIALHLGQPPYRERVEQASKVLNEVSRRKANAAVIFLDNDAHPERVVVRMR